MERATDLSPTNNTNSSVVLQLNADYDQEFISYLWKEYLYPKEYKWVLIVAYIVVFIVALLGNILVHNGSRDGEASLAVRQVHGYTACLQPVLVRSELAIPIVAVSVSVLTLICIVLDRWYAICHPLMFKSTAKRARSSIITIWIVSCVIMIPQATVMECNIMVPELANKTLLFTICDEHWEDDTYAKIYHICFFIVTYMAPLCLIILAYFQIFQKLWCRQIPGTLSVIQRNWKPLALQCSTQSIRRDQTRSRTRGVTAEIKQIQARRKTARMLVVVLIFFAFCYLPISVLNILKRVFGIFNSSNDRATLYALFTFSHWLVYANSAANPIIYNFLSGKFQEEFKTAFSCFDRSDRQNEEHLTRGRTSTESHKSLTAQMSHYSNSSRTSENIVLTNVTTLQASAFTGNGA
ncbi:orexin receptor type 2 [Mobula birostris]|uniref:orexin receptor type 2 n=1 Tax=Mobula birostris TaxID=1983395 RepID=UPI003B27D1B7